MAPSPVQAQQRPTSQEPTMPDHTTETTPEREPDLLTITEAADLLRAPVATLRYWRHLGTGPRSFRLGRRVLYRRNDLHAWIEGQCNEAVDRRPRSGQSTSPARARRPDGCQSPLLTST